MYITKEKDKITINNLTASQLKRLSLKFNPDNWELEKEAIAKRHTVLSSNGNSSEHGLILGGSRDSYSILVSIKGIKVCSPEYIAPETGQDYFYLSPAVESGYGASTWQDSSLDYDRLRRKIIYLDEELIKELVEALDSHCPVTGWFEDYTGK